MEKARVLVSMRKERKSVDTNKRKITEADALITLMNKAIDDVCCGRTYTLDEARSKLRTKSNERKTKTIPFVQLSPK